MTADHLVPRDERDLPWLRDHRITVLLGEGKSLNEAVTIAVDEIKHARR